MAARGGENFDFFGSRLTISGSTVVIAAEEYSTPAGSFTGSAYIFQLEKDSWEQTQVLTTEPPARNLDAALRLTGKRC